MATVTITFGPKTQNYAVSGANLIRLQAWANAVYATLPNGQVNPDPVGSAMDAVWQGLRNNVISWEKANSVAAVPTPGDLT